MFRVAVTLLAALACVSCKPEPAPLAWTVEFESEDVKNVTALVEASIHEGGCGGPVLYRAEVTRDAMTGDVPGTLPVGATYGFSAVALDERCREIATRCVELTLPSERIVIVLRQAVADFSRCSASECNAGRCTGARDAGVDARPDTGATDSGMDAQEDTPPDPCEGVVCGDCEVCLAGACGPSADETACPSGQCWSGACCTGCWDGLTCAEGASMGQCGNGGARCGSCNTGCQECVANTCQNLPDGQSCAGGICRGDPRMCCGGCWDGAGCQPGSAEDACGSLGSLCRDCGGGSIVCCIIDRQCRLNAACI